MGFGGSAAAAAAAALARSRPLPTFDPVSCASAIGTLAGTPVGWLLWWFLLPRIRTPFQRRMGEVLCWGILGAGTWTVFGAAYSDRFGDRPELTAQIHAADAVWGSLGHFSGRE